MTKQILKTVFAGILAGVALFMMPFIIIKVLIFFMLIKAIFRLMGGGRSNMHMRYAYAHKFQNMSKEERTAFMQKYGNRCGWNSKCEPTEFESPENNNRSTGV
jgi:hypothetical protein